MPIIVEQKYIDALVVELEKSEYEGLSITEKAIKLNEPQLTGAKIYSEIQVVDIVYELVAMGKETEAAVFVETLQLPRDGVVSPDDLAPRKVIQGMVASGALTSAEANSLKQLAQVDELGASFGEEIGLGYVYEECIEQVEVL